MLNRILSAALLVSLLLTGITGISIAGSPASTPSTVTPIIVNPLKSPSFWLTTAFIAGGAVLLYNKDDEIKNWVQKKRNGTTDRLAAVGDIFGNGAYTLPPLCLMYLYGHYTGDVKLIRTGVLGVESFVVAGALTTGLKYATHRGRPTEAESFGNFNGFGFSSHDVSFPSGHATSAFAVATVIATQYGDHIAVPIMAYSLAGLTAAARLNDNAHWASDVFVGSAIGYLTAKMLIRIDNIKSAKKLEVAPVLYGRNLGLSLTYRF